MHLAANDLVQLPAHAGTARKLGKPSFAWLVCYSNSFGSNIYDVPFSSPRQAQIVKAADDGLRPSLVEQ